MFAVTEQTDETGNFTFPLSSSLPGLSNSIHDLTCKERSDIICNLINQSLP